MVPLRVGFVLLAVTLAMVLWVVISNMLWIADHGATWLLWINYAFLALLAGVLIWQFQDARLSARAARPPAA